MSNQSGKDTKIKIIANSAAQDSPSSRRNAIVNAVEDVSAMHVEQAGEFFPDLITINTESETDETLNSKMQNLRTLILEF